MLELSPYVIAIIIAWVTAQGAKVVIYMMQTRSVSSLHHLYESGSMPSSHSATAVALATVVGLKDGFDSALFGIALLFAGLVMYDAIMVRRSSGEQGAAIQALIEEQKSSVAVPRAAKGHEPIEVVVGAVIGILIGIGLFFLFQHG